MFVNYGYKKKSVLVIFEPPCIIYSKCLSIALGVQHAMCMCCITLSSVACLALQYFSTLSHKRHNFRKKKLLIFSTTFAETFLILRQTERDMIESVYWSSCKFPLSLLDHKKNLIFLTYFWKIMKYKISQKSTQWEPSCSMQTTRRTNGRADMTKLIIAFHNFPNAPKNWHFKGVTYLYYFLI